MKATKAFTESRLSTLSLRVWVDESVKITESDKQRHMRENQAYWQYRQTLRKGNTMPQPTAVEVIERSSSALEIDPKGLVAETLNTPEFLELATGPGLAYVDGTDFVADTAKTDSQNRSKVYNSLKAAFLDEGWIMSGSMKQDPKIQKVHVSVKIRQA